MVEIFSLKCIKKRALYKIPHESLIAISNTGLYYENSQAFYTLQIINVALFIKICLF